MNVTLVLIFVVVFATTVSIFAILFVKFTNFLETDK